MNCEAFSRKVHFRAELPASERLEIDRHVTGCRTCSTLLLESERLDDLLLGWQPSDAARVGDLSFAERVLRGVHGEGPTAGCAETTSSLHHYVAGDLEPWLAARIERHVAKCHECADHLEDIHHSRRIWLSWIAPDPSPTFADALIRRLEPQTRGARRRRQVIDFVFGPMRVPRAAAALVLVSVTLLSLGVLQMHAAPTRGTIHEVVGGAGAARPISAVALPVVPVATTAFAPGGRGDPTGSFSRDVRGGRNGSLRFVLRGGDRRAGE